MLKIKKENNEELQVNETCRRKILNRIPADPRHDTGLWISAGRNPVSQDPR